MNYRDHKSPLHHETVPRDHHRPEYTVSSDQVPHSSPPHDDGGGRCALTAVLVHPAGQGSEDRENYEMSSPEECLGQHLAHSQVRLRQSREVTIKVQIKLSQCRTEILLIFDLKLGEAQLDWLLLQLERGATDDVRPENLSLPTWNKSRLDPSQYYTHLAQLVLTSGRKTRSAMSAESLGQWRHVL